MDRYEPSQELRNRILKTITTEERHRARKYLAVSFAIAGASAAGMIASSIYAARAIYQSGFYQYLSLAFSDPDVVLTYWREFTLSVVESAPLLGITLVLTAAVALLASVRTYMHNTGRHAGFLFIN